MIDRQELDQKAEEFQIHTTNVQRDYVFGWLLFAIYNNKYLSELLVLKGGNCFRKAYFPNTRFSSDLDFSTQVALDLEQFESELETCCDVAGDASGIKFVPERNSFKEFARANLGKNTDRKIYKGKVFFVDFYGEKSSLEISVRMDITEFDRLHTQPSLVPIIHPYSDADQCQVELKCMSIEECIASKLKCLIQRRHSHDLYDLVYAAFFNPAIDIDRSLALQVFLQKTIFNSSPGSAKEILLGLPVPIFKAAWNTFIVCPIQSQINFENAEQAYRDFIENLFGDMPFGGRISQAFFPSELRNKIMEAGSGQNLMALRYRGVDRIVEPYALTYKRPRNGMAREYLYVFDRTGGVDSEPGIRSLWGERIEKLDVLEDKFEPQFEIELSKAGEDSGNGHFGKQRGARTRVARKSRSSSRPRSVYSGGPKSIVQCVSCGKKFARQTQSTSLRKHKAPGGYECLSRTGFLVGWK